jgi:hypothetical protein
MAVIVVQVYPRRLELIQVYLWDIRGTSSLPASQLDLGLSARVDQIGFVDDQLLAMTGRGLVYPVGRSR